MMLPPPTTRATCTPIRASGVISPAVADRAASSMPNPPGPPRPSPEIFSSTRRYRRRVHGVLYCLFSTGCAAAAPQPLRTAAGCHRDDSVAVRQQLGTNTLTPALSLKGEGAAASLGRGGLADLVAREAEDVGLAEHLLDRLGLVADERLLQQAFLARTCGSCRRPSSRRCPWACPARWPGLDGDGLLAFHQLGEAMSSGRCPWGRGRRCACTARSAAIGSRRCPRCRRRRRPCGCGGGRCRSAWPAILTPRAKLMFSPILLSACLHGGLHGAVASTAVRCGGSQAGHLGDHVLETVVAGAEVGLAADLDHGGGGPLGVDEDGDEAFAGGPAGLLLGLDQPASCAGGPWRPARSPLVSSSAFLHSIMPWPVSSRRALTIDAVISAMCLLSFAGLRQSAR